MQTKSCYITLTDHKVQNPVTVKRMLAELPDGRYEMVLKPKNKRSNRVNRYFHGPLHEYIFLLSKSAKYYYDLDAIKEKCLTNDSSQRDRDNTKLNNTPGRTRMAGLKTNDYELANKRSVWNVSTRPLTDAHFATFPERLIVDMIKAGCPEGGIVLDPFMGAGTTALVARKLNRNYIGFELNSDYVKIAEKRLYSQLGAFI